MRDPGLKAVLEISQNAETFWDVGASIGLFSLFARASNPSLRIVSIEPSTTTYAELVKNCSLSPNDWVCINTAVGAAEGKTYISRGLAGFNHVVSSETDPKIDCEVRPITTLDKLAKLLECRRIDVLKIDVEGMELAVLQGAHELLSGKRIGAVVLEAEGQGSRYGFSDQDILAFMAQYGYVRNCLLKDELGHAHSELFQLWNPEENDDPVADGCQITTHVLPRSD